MIEDKVYDFLSKNTYENIVVLTKPETRVQVLKALLLFGVDDCTGEYVDVSGQKVWVKNLDSEVSSFNYKLVVAYEGDITLKERDSVKAWLKSAQ